ncbi:UNVERIFIED_CONTAM: hypothetical protein ABIE34_002555 [Jeotgalibacillus campisalis]
MQELKGPELPLVRNDVEHGVNAKASDEFVFQIGPKGLEA